MHRSAEHEATGPPQQRAVEVDEYRGADVDESSTEPLPLWRWVFGERAVTMAQTISPSRPGPGGSNVGAVDAGPQTRQRDRQGDPVPLHRLDRIGGGRPVPVVSAVHCEGSSPISQTAITDFQYRKKRWNSDTSRRWWRWPSTGRSPRPPITWARSSPTSPPMWPGSERELGTTLVDRSAGRLTADGEVVVARAYRVIGELDALVADVGALREAVAGNARVGILGTTARWLVPMLLAELSATHPRLHLVVADGTTLGLEPQLAAGRLDLAVLTFPVPGSRPRLGTALRGGHRARGPGRRRPLIGRRAHRDRRSRALRAAAPGSGHPVRGEIDAAVKPAGVRLRPLVELDGVRLLASLTFEGYGPAVLPATAVPPHLRSRFRLVEVDGLAPRQRGDRAAQPGAAIRPGAGRASTPCASSWPRPIDSRRASIRSAPTRARAPKDHCGSWGCPTVERAPRCAVARAHAAGGRAPLHISHNVGPPRGVRISPVTSKPCCP